MGFIIRSCFFHKKFRARSWQCGKQIVLNMKIVFSKHAKERLRERKIKEKDVIWALFAPDWYQPAHQNRIRIKKKIGKRVLEVIYYEEENAIIVITCYLI